MTTNWAWLLAQEAGESAAPASETQQGQDQTSTSEPGNAGGNGDEVPKKPGFPGGFAFPLLMILVVWFFLFIAPQRKKQKEHQRMLGDLKKNDRIQSIGGIVGAVVEIRDQEVVIKIDESNNTKMHLARSAIARVLRDEVKGEQVAEKK